MNGKIKTSLAAIVPRGLITPSGFAWTGLALCVFYVACEALGWREYTTFLSGSVPAGEQANLHLAFGVAYALAYFGFVLVAPVLILAAGIFAVLARAWRPRKEP